MKNERVGKKGNIKLMSEIMTTKKTATRKIDNRKLGNQKLGNEKWKGMKKGKTRLTSRTNSNCNLHSEKLATRKMGNGKLDICYSPCCHNNNAAVGLYYVGLLKTRDHHRPTTD